MFQILRILRPVKTVHANLLRPMCSPFDFQFTVCVLHMIKRLHVFELFELGQSFLVMLLMLPTCSIHPICYLKYLLKGAIEKIKRIIKDPLFELLFLMFVKMIKIDRNKGKESLKMRDGKRRDRKRDIQTCKGDTQICQVSIECLEWHEENSYSLT